MAFTFWKLEKVGNSYEYKIPKRVIVINLVIFLIMLVIGSIIAGVMFGVVLPNQRREAEEESRLFKEAKVSMDNEFNRNVSKRGTEYTSKVKAMDDAFNQNKNSAFDMFNKNFPTQNDNSGPTLTPQPNQNTKPTQIPPDNNNNDNNNTNSNKNNKGDQNNFDNFNKQVDSGRCRVDCFGIQGSCNIDCRFDKKCENQCSKSYQECVSKC